MGDTAGFVQFPHPGGEHRPVRDLMSWNTGMHKRKFLINPASRQSVRGVRDLLPIAVVRQVWESLRDQVLAQDLLLANSLDTPRRVGVRDSA